MLEDGPFQKMFRWQAEKDSTVKDCLERRIQMLPQALATAQGWRDVIEPGGDDYACTAKDNCKIQNQCQVCVCCIPCLCKNTIVPWGTKERIPFKTLVEEVIRLL